MLFAHLKRILRLGRLRLRGPHGAQFEFTLAAIAQNLRRLAKLVVRPPPAVAAVRRIVVVGIGATASKPPLQLEQAQASSFKKSLQPTPQFLQSQTSATKSANSATLVVHSITSSARASSVGGTSRSSARGSLLVDRQHEIDRLHDR